MSNRIGNGPTTDLAVMEPANTDLVRREAQMSWEDLEKQATAIAKSGCFKSGKNPMTVPQVLILMMIARARGIPMIDGLLQYHIIEDQPAIKAATLLARFQEQGGRHKWVTTTDQVVEAEFWHPSLHPEHLKVTREFEDYKAKGVTHGYEGKLKKNWMQSPMQMLMARAKSVGVNAILPGVALGIEVAEDIDAIEVTATPASEVSAKLNQQLKARLTKPAATEPVVDVESTPIAAAKPIETKPATSARAAAEPMTEWGKFVRDRVDVYNSERAGYSALEPARDDLKKPLHPNQVINHVANACIGAEKVGELDTSGKRDSKKVFGLMERVWASDKEAVYELVDDYLEGLLKALGFDPNVFTAPGMDDKA